MFHINQQCKGENVARVLYLTTLLFFSIDKRALIIKENSVSFFYYHNTLHLFHLFFTAHCSCLDMFKFVSVCTKLDKLDLVFI